jgi:hypothetical protein
VLGRLAPGQQQIQDPALLPAEGSDLLYRIKSSDETFERVAKEHELAYRSE